MSRADSFDEIGSEEHDEIIQSLSGSYQSNGAPMFFEHSINTGKGKKTGIFIHVERSV